MRDANISLHIYSISFGNYENLKEFEMTKALKNIDSKMDACFGKNTWINYNDTLYSTTKIEDTLYFETLLREEKVDIVIKY